MNKTIYTVLNLPRKNSKTFKVIKTFDSTESLVKFCKGLGVVSFEKPYIFSSVHLSTQDGVQYRVQEFVQFPNGSTIIVSPEEAFSALVSA